MKKIVIIGGGYGGLRALEHLSKHKGFHITLIDQNPYHYMQTETYGYIAGRFEISDIALDLDTFVKGIGREITFVRDEVCSIDTHSKEVHCTVHRVPYDYLVIAVGAKTHFFSFIEGASEYTHGVKTIQRAFEFRQSFEKQLYQKLEHTNGDTGSHFHIAIAGAGLSGVEIAAEMGYALQRYRKIFSFKSADINISLIDAAPSILPGMDPYIIKKTKARLKKLNVKIYENTFISRINPNSIIFKDGRDLTFDYVIFTAGIKGADLVRNINTEKNHLDQIIPDEKLRLKGYREIFAIGDCTQIQDADGQILPPTAQVAEKSAEYIAHAIVKLDRGETVEPFHAKVDGVFIALGGKYALGILFDRIKVSGYFAYILKKIITRLYRFGLELKINAGYEKRSIE